MSTKFCAYALEWWLTNQNKMAGARVCTQQNDSGDFDITLWEVDGVAKPSEDEINKIIQDYEIFKIDEAANKELRRLNLIEKFNSLGFTDEQISEFIK